MSRYIGSFLVYALNSYTRYISGRGPSTYFAHSTLFREYTDSHGNLKLHVFQCCFPERGRGCSDTMYIKYILLNYDIVVVKAALFAHALQ